MGRKVRVGLPLGNLNSFKDNRGCTYELLTKYGDLDVKGYYPGRARSTPIIKQLKDNFEFHTNKPWQLVNEFISGKLDMMICSSDTVAEAYYSARLLRQEPLYKPDLDFKNGRNMSLRPITTDLSIKPNLFDESEGTLKELWASWKGFILTRNKHYKDELNKIFDLDSKSKQLEEILFSQSSLASYFCPEISLIGDLSYGAVDIHWQTFSKNSNLSEKINKRVIRDEILEDHITFEEDLVSIASEYPAITYVDLARIMSSLFIGVQFRGDKFRQKLIYEPNPREPFKKPKNHYCYSAKIDFLPHRNEDMLKQGFDYDLAVGAVSSGRSLMKSGLVALGEPIFKSSVGVYSHLDLDDQETLSLIGPFMDRLNNASIAYGKERKDSRLHPEFGSWKKDPKLYRDHLEI